MTTLLGVGGSIVGGLIGRLFSKPEPGATFHPAGIILSIIGAIILLFIWGKLRLNANDSDFVIADFYGANFGT